MLTRLKISGFKNLVDVDVRFAPFTCIAGSNGVGKSNLFDALQFLSALADQPLVDAALSVRDEGQRTGDIQSLFHRHGNTPGSSMSFGVEMIVPRKGEDDLAQPAEASITFLRYDLELAYRDHASFRSAGSIELIREELRQINIGDAREHLAFPHSLAWRKSAIVGRRTSPLISTDGAQQERVIKVHQDGNSGRPRQLLASSLPRTVLSAANAAESPTALLARREMQSWRLLQLEPSSLRKPDSFTAPTRLGSDGSHLPATLYHLARFQAEQQPNNEAAAQHVYAQVANRLSELINDVRAVAVDRDERRELLTLYVTDRDETDHQARSLSDGTLRFLALAVLDLDPETEGVLCLEEPENGIHPERIPAILQLLQDIATDVHEPVSAANPLRQVLINTHSPAVVQQVPDDSLLVAELQETTRGDQHFKHTVFSALPDTWRARIDDAPVVARGKLLAYLNPVAQQDTDGFGELMPDNLAQKQPRPRRVIDRPDIQQLMLPGYEPA